MMGHFTRRVLQLAALTLFIFAAYFGGRFLRDSSVAARDLLAETRLPDLGGDPHEVLAYSKTPLVSIGVLEGSAEGAANEFGLVKDASHFADGRIVVLDIRRNTASVFSSQGVPLSIAGRPGRGPGELAVPVAVSTGDDSTLYILDQGNRRVSIYRTRNDTVRLVAEFPVTGDAEDACAIGAYLFLLSPRDSSLITKVDGRTGHVIASFGVPTITDAGLAQSTLAQGLLACDATSGYVAYASKLLGEIRLYRADGSLLWSSSLPHFHRVIALQLPNGAVSLRRPDDAPNDYIATLTFAGQERLLAQYGVKSLGEPIGMELPHSALFDVTTGRRAGVWSGGPIIVDASAEFAIGVRSDPFPQVAVYSFNRTGAGH